jgi:hypothetical protein
MLCDVYNMQFPACYATLQMLGARVPCFVLLVGGFLRKS